MKGRTFIQRQSRMQRDLINAASREDRKLTVYPATGPSVIVHSVKDWADSPRKRNRAARPGGKLPAGVSVAVRHAARLAREATS